MSRPKPPCRKECPRRVPGCGTSCKEWLEYVEERNKAYEEHLVERSNEEISIQKLRAIRKKKLDRKKGRNL